MKILMRTFRVNNAKKELFGDNILLTIEIDGYTVFRDNNSGKR